MYEAKEGVESVEDWVMNEMREVTEVSCARYPILSAKDAVKGRVEGLRLRTDNYVVKPFSFEELFARLHSHARRKYTHRSPW